MLALVVHTPGRPPWQVPLDRPVMRLGRSPDCEIVVDESEISREHIQVRLVGGVVEIEDLGSRNGVFVDEDRVQRIELRVGDRVRLGRNVTLELATPRGEPRRKPASPSFRPWGWARRVAWGLVPVEGGRRAPPIPVRGGSVTVGRQGDAALTVEDESVSRLHARLDREGEALFVVDLKSRNGTQVNGEPVVKRSPLSSGDEVQFGDVAFRVVRTSRLDLLRLGLATLFALVVAAVVVVALSVQTSWIERSETARENARLRKQAVASVRKGIAAYERGDVDFARSYLLYAADVVQLLGLAPPGASLSRPETIFRRIVVELSPAEREFEFGRALDAAAAAASRAQLEGMTNREYVAHQVRRVAVELGQDEHVSDGFIEQVWDWIDDSPLSRSFQVYLDRSARIHPHLRETLRQAHLPETFCYVAWVESGLNPRARSPVGAVGLWQFMPSAAKDYKLRPGPPDEREDMTRSTEAAREYLSDLVVTFGREQFMCALASYNHGPGAVRQAMRKIEDPMMPSSLKFWYLVDHGLLPRETSDYVPKIFAAQIMAENPERFGLRRPGPRTL